MGKRDGSSRADRQAKPDTGALGLRVVGNTADQQEEQIPPSTIGRAQDPLQRPAARVVANGKVAAEEPISARKVAQGDHPRLSIGARVRENRAYQTVQKIARADLTVPADDEIGYKKLFTRFEEGFVTQDIAKIGTCLSPSFQWHLPNGDVAYGKAEALAEMERRFAMPNGPRFSASVWRFKGTTVIQTYEVEFMGADGRWRASLGMDLYEIGGGLITRKDAYWKMIP